MKRKAIVIEKFKEKDIIPVVNLWNESLKEDAKKAPWYIEESKLSEEKLRNAISSSDFDPLGAFIAKKGDEIIGFGMGIVRKDWRNTSVNHVSNLWVSWLQ